MKMDSPSNLKDSNKINDDSVAFKPSGRMFESTPIVPNENALSRKRKLAQLHVKRHLSNVFESCTSTPRIPSLLSESITKNLEKIHIERSEFVFNSSFDGINKTVSEDTGYFEYDNSPKRLRNADYQPDILQPSTPEYHNCDTTPCKASSSFTKSFANITVNSPYKEEHDILYPILKSLEPPRKPLSPQKLKEKIESVVKPAKKCLFIDEEQSPFVRVVSNEVIMRNLFQYLSNGELFRLSMSCKAFRNAIQADLYASSRFISYRLNYREHKENYTITPPGSPERNEGEKLYFTGSGSPSSQRYKQFINLGSSLKENQSLIKCHTCAKPSVVDKNIAQCTDTLRCGYILCLKCNSFAYKPEDFVDTCQAATLLTRKRLDDLSNNSHSFDINESSIFSSTLNNYSTNVNGKDCSSSGYYSGVDSPVGFKRNLTSSFAGNESYSKPVVLQESNKPSSYYESRRKSTGLTLNENCGFAEKTKTHSPLVPVIENVSKRTIRIVEPPSSPKSKPHAIGSKQSKKNLKRLTR